MKNDLQILQDQITPEILGLFWITNEKLSDLPRPFHAIDYFLDGVLTTTSSKKARHKNFFIGHSFDQVFFVGHLQNNDSNLQSEIKEIMELVQTLNVSQKKILLIDENSNKNLQFLNKQYSDFTYKQIELGKSNDIRNP